MWRSAGRRGTEIPFRLDGVVRIDDTPVHRAIREALANCLVNTDFYLPRGVVIKKDRDSIIMKMFNLIGIGEHAGSGVPDIYSVWEHQGWIAPEVTEEYSPDRTILKLVFMENENVKKSAIKIGDKKSAITEERLKRILQYMDEKTEYRADELAEGIGLKSSRTRQLLNMLVEREVVEVLGKNKGRKYRKRE